MNKIDLVNRIVAAIGQELQEDFSGHMISGAAEQLLALLDVRNTVYQ